MKLYNIPFNGLFVVYAIVNGEPQKLFYGFQQQDIPEEIRGAEVNEIYPYNDSIIVIIK